MRKIFFLFILCAQSIFAGDFVPSIYIWHDSTITKSYSEAHFKFVDSPKHFPGFQGTQDFETSINIRVRGNSTSDAPKKPYNIKFSKKTDLLNMGKAKKWVLLSNPFDPTLMRNKLVYDLAGKLPFIFSPKSYYVDVWLNDVFIGNYQLTQNIEFNSQTWDYDVDNGDYLIERDEKRHKSDSYYFHSPLDSIRFASKEPDSLSDNQLEDLQKKLLTIEKAISTKDINQYIQYVDLLSMIDYYWIEEFVSEPDLKTGSIFFSVHDSILRGGPVWDFDLALGNTTYAPKQATTNYFVRNDIWWQYLFQDSLFEKIANERYLELSPYFENLAQNNELGGNQIDSLLSYFKDSFDRNFSDSGWVYCDPLIDTLSNARKLTCPFSPIPLKTFEENIEKLRTWIIERNKYLKKNAEEALQKQAHINITLRNILHVQDSLFALKDSLANTTNVPSADNDSTTIKNDFTDKVTATTIIPLISYDKKAFSSHKGSILFTKKRKENSYSKNDFFLINGKTTHINANNIYEKK